MKCPNCKEHNLVLSERKGIEIDYCPECRGVWLDRGELDKIIEESQDQHPPENRESSFQQTSQSSQSDYNQKPYRRKKSFLEELFD